MIQFGFEREFFVLDKKRDVTEVPSHIPNDSGLLAEARGRPHRDPIDAAFSLKAETHKIRRLVEAVPKRGLQLDFVSDYRTVDREIRINARRTHTKGLIHFQNLYDDKIVGHDVDSDTITAGLHVSVTRQTTTHCQGDGCSRSTTTNLPFDFARFVRAADERFADEIKRAKRRPGFYEMKPDGRIEYRSLPQSISIIMVAEWLAKNVKLIHGSW